MFIEDSVFINGSAVVLRVCREADESRPQAGVRDEFGADGVEEAVHGLSELSGVAIFDKLVMVSVREHGATASTNAIEASGELGLKVTHKGGHVEQIATEKSVEVVAHEDVSESLNLVEELGFAEGQREGGIDEAFFVRRGEVACFEAAVGDKHEEVGVLQSQFPWHRGVLLMAECGVNKETTPCSVTLLSRDFYKCCLLLSGLFICVCFYL